MENLLIIAYPYATQYGNLKVPENMSEDEKQQYIKEHWNDITFREPDLDYCGTDFEFETEE